MNGIANPVIRQINDNIESLSYFETHVLAEEDDRIQEIIRNYPTVYIHNWKNSDEFEVYVGESNDIFKRTRQHYDEAGDLSKWQSKLEKYKAKLYIIAHEHFNKSLTLDIENRLMLYMASVERVKHVHNLRDNPQKSYYPKDELDEIMFIKYCIY